MLRKPLLGSVVATLIAILVLPFPPALAQEPEVETITLEGSFTVSKSPTGSCIACAPPSSSGSIRLVVDFINRAVSGEMSGQGSGQMTITLCDENGNPVEEQGTFSAQVSFSGPVSGSFDPDSGVISAKATHQVSWSGAWVAGCDGCPVSNPPPSREAAFTGIVNLDGSASGEISWGGALCANGGSWSAQPVAVTYSATPMPAAAAAATSQPTAPASATATSTATSSPTSSPTPTQTAIPPAVETATEDKGAILPPEGEVSSTVPGVPPAGAKVTGPPSVSDLVRDLEEFLAGKGAKGPTPEQAAAAGGASATLIAAWMLNKYLSGARKEDVEEAARKWRRGREATLPEAVPVSGGESIPGKRPIEQTEGQLRRGVDTADEYVKAMEKSRKEFKQVVDKVPEQLKETEFWKKKVQPQLDKVSKYTNPEKVRKTIDEIRRLLDRRQVWEKGPARHMDPEKRDLLIGFDRVVTLLPKAAEKLHDTYIIDPLKTAADKLPKPLAEPAKKFAERHKKDMGELFTGGRDAIRKGMELAAGGEERAKAVDALKAHDPRFYEREVDTEIPLDPKHKPDFGKGLRKIEPLRRKAGEGWESFRSWWDKHGLIYGKRIPRLEPD